MATDPSETLRKIRERWPKLGTEGLLRVFEVTIVDDAELRRTIVTRAFVQALQEISTSPPQR